MVKDACISRKGIFIIAMIGSLVAFVGNQVRVSNQAFESAFISMAQTAAQSAAIATNTMTSTRTTPTGVFQSREDRERAILRELTELTDGDKVIECPDLLVPFYNRVVYPEQRNTTGEGYIEDQKIPRIIHVSHKSRCMPPDMIDVFDEYKKRLPNYSIFFHDDDAVDRLFYDRDWSASFPHLTDTLKCAKPGAMTIDIWRT
eukprot:scaffold1007_cov176-Amphora_coffeaeformis.AAC.25